MSKGPPPNLAERCREALGGERNRPRYLEDRLPSAFIYFVRIEHKRALVPKAVDPDKLPTGAWTRLHAKPTLWRMGRVQADFLAEFAPSGRVVILPRVHVT